jgi:hypothetical protein
MSQPYESKILDHLGLVAGMYDELEIGRGISDSQHRQPYRADPQATQGFPRGGFEGDGAQRVRAH